MSDIYQIGCISWIIFTFYLVYRVQYLSKIKVGGEVYYKASGLQLSISLLAAALLIGNAIF